MEKCLAKYGVIAGAKTLTAEGVAIVAAEAGCVGIAYSWAWFNVTFPYMIPLSAFGVYMDCQRTCSPYVPDGDTTFNGAP